VSAKDEAEEVVALFECNIDEWMHDEARGYTVEIVRSAIEAAEVRGARRAIEKCRDILGELVSGFVEQQSFESAAVVRGAKNKIRALDPAVLVRAAAEGGNGG